MRSPSSRSTSRSRQPRRGAASASFLLLLPALILGCASSPAIRPIYETQSASLVKGEIALLVAPYGKPPEGDPYALGAVRLEERIDDYFKRSLAAELGAFGLAVKGDARLELQATILKAETRFWRQGRGGSYETSIEARFTIRDRLNGNAIVYDRVHNGGASHSFDYSGYPASASLVGALGKTYVRLLSDASLYDKLVGEFGFSKSAKPALASADGSQGKGDALELLVSSLSAFPTLAKYYDDHPVGSATLRNRLAIPATNIRISLFVPSYMDAPKECAAMDRLADKAQVDLYALFNDKIMGITEGAKAAATLTAEYEAGGLRCSQSFPLTMRIQNRNALVWDDDRKAAAFVTAKDPLVMGFAKSVTGMLAGQPTGEINRKLLKAAILHEALAAYGLGYETDPYSNYASAKDGAVLDFLQFPRQTLEYKSGDCDDLSILYCALLESVGVETAFITVPQHIYMAFAVDDAPEGGVPRWNYPDDFIVRGGKIWLPVETTLVREDFVQAWQAGRDEWTKGRAAGKAELYPIHDAWKDYEAVDFKESLPAVVQPDGDKVLARFAPALDRFVEREIYPSVKRLKSGTGSSADDRARSGNRLATLYARFGRYDAALEELELILGSREYMPALVNAGNVHFLRGDLVKAKEYYERACRAAPENPNAVLQLSRTLYELKDYGRSEAAYARLKKLDSGLAGAYVYLQSEEGAKAEAARESLPWLE